MDHDNYPDNYIRGILNTVKSIAMAWVLTLPCAMILAGALYFLFTKIF